MCGSSCRLLRKKPKQSSTTCRPFSKAECVAFAARIRRSRETPVLAIDLDSDGTSHQIAPRRHHLYLVSHGSEAFNRLNWKIALHCNGKALQTPPPRGIDHGLNIESMID